VNNESTAQEDSKLSDAYALYQVNDGLSRRRRRRRRRRIAKDSQSSQRSGSRSPE
jgi:hypothetical protein